MKINSEDLHRFWARLRSNPVAIYFLSFIAAGQIVLWSFVSVFPDNLRAIVDGVFVAGIYARLISALVLASVGFHFLAALAAYAIRFVPALWYKRRLVRSFQKAISHKLDLARFYFLICSVPGVYLGHKVALYAILVVFGVSICYMLIGYLFMKLVFWYDNKSTSKARKNHPLNLFDQAFRKEHLRAVKAARSVFRAYLFRRERAQEVYPALKFSAIVVGCAALGFGHGAHLKSSEADIVMHDLDLIGVLLGRTSEYFIVYSGQDDKTFIIPKTQADKVEFLE